MVFTGRLFAQKTSMVSRLPQVEHQLGENFGCRGSLEVYDLMLFAFFVVVLHVPANFPPRLLGRAAAFPFDTLKAGVLSCSDLSAHHVKIVSR